MKAVVQRVLNASVKVNGEIISSINNGLCVFVGISNTDSEIDMNYIIEKVLKLKLFENEGKKWNSSVTDKHYEVLCISQFTLYSNLKSNKLDFHCAMPASSSQAFYYNFLESLRSQYSSDLVKDGKFGEMMEVSLVNDGPVTVQIESPKRIREETAV